MWISAFESIYVHACVSVILGATEDGNQVITKVVLNRNSKNKLMVTDSHLAASPSASVCQLDSYLIDQQLSSLSLTFTDVAISWLRAF